jgi:hypothetical protein
MAIKLRIPDGYAASLAEFVKLSPEELAAFLGAAREREPSLALTELTNAIADQLAIGRQRMGEIVRTLSDLQTVREGYGLSVRDFVSQLHEAIVASGKAELLPRDWAAFEDAISEALSGDNAIAITSKARSVASEYPNVFCSGRILTDLRPVFGADVGQSPAAFVVIHTLKLVYHENDSHQEFFVSLDRGDLEDLKMQAERALKKEISIKAHMAEKGVKILEDTP